MEKNDEEPDGLLKQPAGGEASDATRSFPASPDPHGHHPSAGCGATFAGIAGNVLEWYDFAVFGYLVDVLAKVFFPPGESETTATLQAFAVFGGAFLIRPLGGVLLGYIGDVYGRKRALVLSIFLMAFPTFAMGCLPTYDQVGGFAIFLLILVRLLQGLSVGGQLMSSAVFTLESHDPRHWGLYGSYVMAAANFGTLLGALVGEALQNNLTPEQLEAWGWRLPFLGGIFVSGFGFYLKGSHAGEGEDEDVAATSKQPVRSKSGHVPVRTSLPATEEEVDEENGIDNGIDSNGDTSSKLPSSSPDEDEIVASSSSQHQPASINPLRLAFAKENRRSLAASAMVPVLSSAGFYLSFVWMADYMADLVEPPVEDALKVNSISLLVSVCLFFPVAGILSDWYGRKLVMTIGGVGMAVLSPIMVAVIGRGGTSSWVAILAQSTLGVSYSFWGSPMCAWLVESFDPASRLTSVSIGFNIGQATAGGVAPALATYMVEEVGTQSPGWILTALAAIAMTGLWCVAPQHPPAASHDVQHFHAVPVSENHPESSSPGESEMVDVSSRQSNDRRLRQQAKEWREEDHEIL